MLVRFQPLFGQDVVILADLAGLSFEAGQEHELDDKAFVRAATEPGGTRKDGTTSDADLVLTNPNFVDAATGKNPRFHCPTCGALILDRKVDRKIGIAGMADCKACAKAPAPAPAAPAAESHPDPVPQPPAEEHAEISEPTHLEHEGD